MLGEGINEIAATAKSANDSAGELASRVKVLEERRGSSGGVFQARDGSLTAVTTVSWAVWSLGRIYPPEGTYWVEATTGANLEHRGQETVSLTLPAVVTVTEGDYLLIKQRQDGQAIRVTPV